MPLQPPKRTPAGFFLALQPAVTSPRIRWTNSVWDSPTGEWMSWADSCRKTLIGELLSHGNWFSRPPRHDIIEPLFSPWSAKSMQGNYIFSCKEPQTPGAEGSSGSAAWQLEGIIMSATSISPVWSVVEPEVDEMQDTISLFGDGETVDGDDDSVDSAGAPETREIQFEDIADASPELQGTVTHVRSREWEARKFLAKERVREARLKAQIATRLARKEEARFYSQFGDLDDGESHFSDYDLTDDESERSESSSDGAADER